MKLVNATRHRPELTPEAARLDLARHLFTLRDEEVIHVHRRWVLISGRVRLDECRREAVAILDRLPTEAVEELLPVLRDRLASTEAEVSR